MEFKQLRSFVAVVRERSFTKAAHALYLSQPTISMHIRQLEEEFHAKLIVRTTKSIELTARGREFYDFAEGILAQCERLTARWAEEGQNAIHLGVSTIPSAYVLPEILPAYQKLQPEIRFLVHQSDSAGILNGLRENRFDLGMTGMKDGDEQLCFLPFYQDHMVLITPDTPAFRALAEEKNGLTPDIFRRQAIILREAGSGSEQCVEEYFDKLGLSGADLNVVARLNDVESIKRLAEQGLGVAVVSEKAVQGTQSHRLLVFELPRFRAERQLYLAYRRDEALPTQVRAFIDFALGFYTNPETR